MSSPAPASRYGALLDGFSLGVTAREAGELDRARAVLAPGTQLHVGFRDNSDMAARLMTARAIRRAGFTPVPIIPARRQLSREMLRRYLAGLRDADASGCVLVVAGDPDPPRGPYPDAASVIGSGLLEEHGVREVRVAGHPGGHPAVADSVLWAALADKTDALRRRGLAAGIITQFGFDASQALTWVIKLRARGIDLPVRVSVPGPASARLLLKYASVCGVTVSPVAAGDYGLAGAGPGEQVGPDRMIRALAAGYDPRLHGEVKLRFDIFTGFAATLDWITAFLNRG